MVLRGESSNKEYMSLNNNKTKRRKNVDSVTVSLFLKGLAWALPFLCLLGLVYEQQLGGKGGAFVGLILGVVASVVASLLTMFVSGKFGGFFAFIYRGPKANWSIKEQLKGDLDQVRYHKMNKRYDQALLKVDEVLAKAPDYVDALYLKAGILWEGFNEPFEAKRHLGIILKKTPKTENCYNWASILYENIVKEEKKRLNDIKDQT